MLVVHNEQIIRQLREIAEVENRSVEDVLKSLLAQYPPRSTEPAPGTSAWFTAHLDEITFETDHPIDPEQADDILNAEFADYLLKRMGDESASNSGG